MSDNEQQDAIQEHPQSPSVLGGLLGNGSHDSEQPAGDAQRGLKRSRHDEDDDDDEKPRPDRRKIEIKFIQDKSRRHITFSKRKAGIMKKAYELSVLTGTQVLLLVVSETGLVYTFTTPKLQPLVTKAEGKNLIQACLNAPEPSVHVENNNEEQHGAEDNNEENPHGHAQISAQATSHRPATVPMGAYHFPDHQQAAAYQQLLAAQQAQHVQQSHQQRAGYAMSGHSIGNQITPHPSQAS